jgi:hypothetical protein
MRMLGVLLSAATVVRLVLVCRGGQYFDWDEYRYGFSTLMLERLRQGDAGGALDILFRYPEHPLFKAFGVAPAALQHLLGAGGRISDMRYPAGEWLPAFVFSLSSVCSIGLTYAVGGRAGASRQESLLAAFLMFASTSMLMHARHFFPYDLALALMMLALWCALSPRERAVDSLNAGMLAGAGFATYLGFWLLPIVVMLVHVWWRPARPVARLRRAALFGLGLVVVPGLLIAVSALRNRPLVQLTRVFSRTVTSGDFAEGWSLPWAFFWHAEGGVLLFVLAGTILALRHRSPRGVRWAAAAIATCTGLAIWSNVLHRFVVYDRLARQMWPFLCLAAAAGIANVQDGRWLRGPRAGWLYGALTALFIVNSWPLFTQRYPRDIIHEVIARYGADAVAFDTNLQHTVDSTSGLFFPSEPRGGAKRYVLVNARDLWFRGEPATRPLPPGRVIASWRHPRELRFLQYHGYTALQRAFVRSADVSMRLIDRSEDSAALPP